MTRKSLKRLGSAVADTLELLVNDLVSGKRARKGHRISHRQLVPVVIVKVIKVKEK